MVRGEGVETVLGDVEVDRRQIDRAQVEDLVERAMELQRRPLAADADETRGQVIRERAIDLRQALVRHGVRWREVGEVAEQEAERVAHLAVGIGHALQDLVADAYVAAPVGRERPPADDVGAVLVDELERVDHVALRLVHRVALTVEHPAVRRDVRVGRDVLDAHTDHERRVEPAAMLVRPLEVHDLSLALASLIPRRLEVGMLHLDRAVRAARVEPHVEHVLLLAERTRALARRTGVARGEEVLDRTVVPRVGVRLANDRGGLAHDARIERRRAAALAVDRGDADAPTALSRQAPIGAAAHRLADAITRALGIPRHGALDLIDAALAMAGVVHDHEPLVGGAEDDRLAAAPAVRVAVIEARGVQQHALLAEPADDVLVHVEHAAAGEVRHVGREATALVHGADDAEAAALADLEVLGAVAGRGVHDTGAILHAHVRRTIHDARVVTERAREDRADEVRTAHRGERLEGRTESLRERRDACRRDEDRLTGDARDGVIGRRIDHEAEVRGQRPRGRGPRDRAHVGMGREGARGGILSQREAHEDARRGHVGVLDLGHGECRAIGRAPVDRALATLDEAALVQAAQRLEDLGLELRGHRAVRTEPVAPTAETDELLSLRVDPLRRVLAAGAAQLEARRLLLLLGELPTDLHLDRHAVIVPTRHVRRVEALQRRLSHRGVLPDLVRGRAHVDVAVRVGRTVVEQPHRTALARGAQRLVGRGLRPRLESGRLTRREIRLHREGGLGHVHRVLVPGLLGAVRHATSVLMG